MKKGSPRDAARRHIARQHPEIRADVLPRSKILRACSLCQARKTRCDGSLPCQPCENLGYPCNYSQNEETRAFEMTSTSKRIPLTPKAPPQVSEPSGDARLKVLSFPCVSVPRPPLPHALNLEKEVFGKCISYYFVIFHPSWPIIHRPSFDETSEDEGLVKTMAMMGAWESNDPLLQQSSLSLQPRLLESICQRLVRLRFSLMSFDLSSWNQAVAGVSRVAN